MTIRGPRWIRIAVMAVLAAALTPAIAGAATLVALSGVITDAHGAPLSGAIVSFATSSNMTAADGSYTLYVSPGTGGSLQVAVPTTGTYDEINLASAGSPGSPPLVATYSALESSTSRTINANTTLSMSLTDLPAPVVAHVLITDSQGTPVPSTQVMFIAHGGVVPTSSVASDGTKESQQLSISQVNPAILNGAFGTQAFDLCTTDASGHCDFRAPAGAAVTFQVAHGAAPAGYPQPSGTGIWTQDATMPTTDGNLTVSAGGYAFVSGGGQTDSVATSSGIIAPGASLSTPTSAELPPGAVVVSNVLSYSIKKVPVGGTIQVTVGLPPGSAPTAVYKVVGNAFVDVTSIATIKGNAVTLSIADGGVGDEDGVANGVIVDPLLPVKHVVGTATLTLKTSAKITKSGSSKKVALSVSATSGLGPHKGTVQLFDGAKLVKTLSVKAGASSTTLTVSANVKHSLYVKYLGSVALRPTCSLPITF